MNKIIMIAVITIGFSCEKTPRSADELNDKQTEAIVLNQSQMDYIELQIGKVDSVQILEKIRVNGYVDVPPEGKASITTFKAGYVKEVLLLVGDEVKKGQQLAVLEDPEYVKIQQHYLDLNGRLSFLRAEYERQQILYVDNIIAEKVLLKSEAEFKSVEAQHKGLGQELKMLGLRPNEILAGNITSSIKIISPISGSVTKMNCTVGKHIPASFEMFEIIDPDHLHMELNIFEKDIAKVQVGQTVLATIPNLDAGLINGEVFLVARALDNASRSIRVHAHFEDESTTALPGMYLEAEIITNRTDVLALPVNAVITEGNSYYIFVQRKSNAGEFEKRVVAIGASDEVYIEIVNAKDLLNEQIVINGAYNLSGYSQL